MVNPTLLAPYHSVWCSFTALNRGRSVRSLCLCCSSRRVKWKAAVNTEEHKVEKETCYLVEHKATEKAFWYPPLWAHRECMILTFSRAVQGGRDKVIEVFFFFFGLFTTALKLPNCGQTPLIHHFMPYN